MEKKAIEVIKDFLEEENYVIMEQDDDSILIRYQMSNINIAPDQRDNRFCCVCLPISAEITDDNTMQMLCICNAVSLQERVVKAYLSKDSLLVTYEFNFDDEEQLTYNLTQAFDALVHARASIRKLQLELDNDKEEDE